MKQWGDTNYWERVWYYLYPSPQGMAGFLRAVIAITAAVGVPLGIIKLFK